MAGAPTPDGRDWEVTLIRPGISRCGNYFDEDVLREAAPLFVRAPVYAFETRPGHFDQLRGAAKAWKHSMNPVGRILEAWQAPDGRLKGALRIEGADWLRRRLLEAYERGIEALALSQCSVVRGWREAVGGTPVFLVRRFSRVDSVDVVTPPSAAGGRFDRPLPYDHARETLRMWTDVERCLSRVVAELQVGSRFAAAPTEVR